MSLSSDVKPIEPPLEKPRPRLVTALIETFGFSPLLASLVSLFLLLLGAAAVVWLWLSAPPRTLTLTSGPPGSSFQRNAEAYQKALAEHGVTLVIKPSGGSLDNLKRLQDPKGGVDIGFVQGGLVETAPPDLVSLGSVSYQPLWLFYRGARITRLSELAGKRIGIGAPGSGSHALATALLQTNGITGPPTTLVDDGAEGAANDLLAGKLDAIFLMGDSASLTTLRTLTRAPDVHIYHYTQADAYVRRNPHLNKIILPEGSIDFGRNVPAQNIALIGPAVELIARKGLNSAVSDILLDVVKETHDRAGLLNRKGEFPALVERVIPISSDAKRFYKSGMGFTYEVMSSLGVPRAFWIANLVNRALVAIVPLILLLIPTLRLVPIAYKWSVQLRIYRCYRPLLKLEREAQEEPLTPKEVEGLVERLDEIENEVNQLQVPASFAYQFYALRGHVAFVRARLRAAAAVA